MDSVVSSASSRNEGATTAGGGGVLLLLLLLLLMVGDGIAAGVFRVCDCCLRASGLGGNTAATSSWWRPLLVVLLAEAPAGFLPPPRRLTHGRYRPELIAAVPSTGLICTSAPQFGLQSCVNS